MTLLQDAQIEFLDYRFTVVYDWKTSEERTYPQRYLQSISNIVSKRQMKTIVEIGSIRYAYVSSDGDRHPCKEDGQALWYWAQTGATVHSVDIDPHCLTAWAWSGGENYPMVHQYIMDGLQFLKDYSGPSIDFLYLDGWDVGSAEYQQRHLDAYLLAKPKMAKNCIIAIDDDDFSANSKGQLVYPMLITDGFINVAKGRVSVWIRDTEFIVSV